MVIEPTDNQGRPYSQEECCWGRGTTFVPHLLGQVCAAHGIEKLTPLPVTGSISADHAVLILSWIFGDKLKPLVDRLVRTCGRVSLVANPATTAPYLREVFPGCLVTTAAAYTAMLRPFAAQQSDRASFVLQYATGCPWRCAYCPWQNRYRLYDPFAVAEAYCKRVDAVGDCTANLLGNELSGKTDWLAALVSGLPSDASFTSSLNVRNTSPEDVRLCKLAGIRRACLGVEFATDEMLERLGKGHSVDDAARVMRWLQDAGIDYRFSLRSGVGETAEQLREMSGNLEQWAQKGLSPHKIVCGGPMTAWPGVGWQTSDGEWVNTGSDTFPRYVRRMTPELKDEWANIINQTRQYGWTN